MSTDLTSHPSAGRRRFWVTVLCFVLINAAVWVVYDRYYAWRHRGTLRVELFEPGDNAVVGPKASLRWRFSDDVIPTSVYGKDPGRMSPIVAGRWAWENPRTLSFVPAVDLPRATPVTFTLASELLRSDTGGSLAAPYVTCVHSMPLEVKDIQQFSALDGDQFVVEIKFNDRVAPGDVLQHLTATLPDGRAVQCRLFGQATGPIVRLATDAIPVAANESQTQLTVKLTPGLTGLSGPLGLADPFEATVALGRSLCATQMTAVAPTRGQPYLNLSFNNDIDINIARKVLSIDPAVPFTLESSDDDHLNLHGDLQSGTRYTVHIAAAPKGTSADDLAKYPRAGQLAAFVPDRGSDVWLDNDQGYLSTAGNRTLIAHVVNVSAITVSVTRMYDNNLVAWRNASEGEQWVNTDSFSKPIAKKSYPSAAGRNVQRDVQISLDDLLPADVARAGVWQINIEQKKDDSDSDNTDDEDHPSRYRDDGESNAVVTLSDIGLTAKQTRDGMVAWAASLRTAQSLANVRIRVYSTKNQLLGEALTDVNGLARLPALNPAKDELVSVLLADFVPTATTQPTTQPTAPTELTWLDIRHTGWELGDSDTSGQPYLRTGSSAFVFTDRGVYRPGETLHLRAIVHGPGDVAPAKTFPVKWQLRRPDSHDWKSEMGMIDTNGGASVDVPLPMDLPSGQWSASIGLPGDTAAHSTTFGTVDFQVENFMPNRLKASLSLNCGDDKSPARYLISDAPLEVDVQGDYLFGRPAAGLAVDLTNHATPTTFQPTGWDGWSFGDTADINSIAPNKTAIGHVKHHRKSHLNSSVDVQQAEDSQQPDSIALDDHGHYHGDLDVSDIIHLSHDPGQYTGPWRMTTDAGVSEIGGRAVTVSQQIEIDALPRYIAVHRNTDSPQPGQPCDLQLKLVKPSGAPANDVDGDLQAELFRDSWNTVLVYRNGRYHYDSTRVLDPVDHATVHLDSGVANWTVTPKDSGQFVAKFTDRQTGAITTTEFDITDGSGWNDNVDRANPEHLDIRVLRAGESETTATVASSNGKTGSSSWHVGDTGRVLIASPFTGRLLLSVETDDVVQTQVIDLTSSHMVVPIAVTAACRPGAFITATVIRPIDPNAKWRTHRAFGVTRLNIDPGDRRLHIALDAPEILRPMQSLDIGMKVTDPDGNAVANATVTVAAVDEGICSLTDFRTPDPLASFTSKRALGVRSADLYGLLMPEVAKVDSSRDTGGDVADVDMGRHHSPVGARRVKPVALAWAEVHTDADGMARASFPVPEFEGRLRVMAIGYTASMLGSADRGVTVRSPILAQTSWPRFAAPGDQFTVPVVMFNNTNTAGVAQVSVELLNDAGLLAITGASPSIAIAPSGQSQTMFNVNVAQAVGVAKVRLTVAMNGETYQEETELPVRPASPMMQFGGMLAGSTTRPTLLTNLSAMMPGTGSLRVAVTPWPTLQLPQGLDYLDRYPYGCVEQTTSTCFPLIALGDVGRQIDPVRFDPDRIKQKIDSGVTQLIGMQTADGGLSMWPGETDAWPWASIYSAHFLTEAKAAGYQVPDDFYNHLLDYVRHLQDQGTDDAQQIETQAYAAYVMTLAGKPDRAILDRLTELASEDSRSDDPTDGRSMRSDARLFLSCAWLLAGRRDLAEGLLPDAMPEPRSNRQFDGNLGSPIRDRALLILAMEQVQPDRPELPQLVQELADQGSQNHWASTQDVAFSVLSLGRYLRDAHNHKPYDTAELSLEEKVIAQSSGGQSLAWEGQAPSSQLSVALTGANDAIGHVSWIQTGVPMSPPKDAEHGLKVHRRYLTLDNQEIVGSVRTGDLVRVEITLEAPPDQANLVIEDLLPAGLEVENPRLETAAKDRAEDSSDNQLPTFGNGRVDVQDDRVVIAGSMPSTWKARCTYLARAVTPGAYTVPPVHAEAMYDLNTNAMSGSGKLTVLPVVPSVAAAE